MYGVDRDGARRQGRPRRRARAVPRVRHELPAGPAAGRARRAVRQHLSTPRGTITATSTPSWRTTAGMADQPVAALIKDLKQRGLLDATLVVWASEFGRTPLGENRGGSRDVTGRDHHPFAFTHLDGRRRRQGRPGHRRDRRDRLGRRRGPGPRQRPARHDPAPVRPRPPEADATASRAATSA